jgi:hypothetical protein
MPVTDPGSAQPEYRQENAPKIATLRHCQVEGISDIGGVALSLKHSSTEHWLKTNKIVAEISLNYFNLRSPMKSSYKSRQSAIREKVSNFRRHVPVGG